MTAERSLKTSLWKAVLAFQAEAPALQRDKLNPAFRSKYLSLDALMEQTLPLLNKHGLVWTTSPNYEAHGGEIHPKLSYRLIHAESGEETAGTLPLILAKKDMQGLGSAVTYARRYAMMSVLGLVADEDDDGAKASRHPVKAQTHSGMSPAPLLSSEQRARVVKAIEDAGKDVGLILAAVGAEATDDLTVAHARLIPQMLGAAS